jgi:GMP synthase-like glutamine amidotransferase
MRVHYLQHVPFEGLGSIAPWLAARGAQVTATRLYEEARFPKVSEIDWLVVMGGPMSVNDEAARPWLVAEKRFIAEAIGSMKAVLGVCLGSQLIASSLGARVYGNRERELGWFPIEPAPGAPDSPFADLFRAPVEVFHWHGQTFDLPPRAAWLARSAGCAHQAFSIGDRVLGLQFHAEPTADTVRALADHCPEDFAPARFVQSRDEILRDEARFTRVNRVMDAILDRLEELTA